MADLAFRYNYAIVCRIPNSFRTGSSRAKGQVDLQRCREEHRNLIETLKVCGVSIIELEAAEAYPDCHSVEDTAVVIGGTALIANPGCHARRGEVAEIRTVLKRDLNFTVTDIKDPLATVDGGDVFFTGKEIVVGVSERTNRAGACAVAMAFQDYNVFTVNVPGPKPLKAYIQMAGKDIMAVGNSPEAKKIYQQIISSMMYQYKKMELDDEAVGNLIYVNGHLIHRTRNEIKDSYVELQKMRVPRKELSVEALSRAGYCLFSCALLILRCKYPKAIVSTLP
ncbi:N(G),N(G)-dimethylarginine dimethylaminohydrolase 1-like isoform X2 [Liolophura sinensis]|uniref:N(G),N(G)-dimethylarginine dimethylaminohydrolase 1-like isoform X2 n=1 Tax=Liolophura sinensis TaxID=3198878 RepID=UPI00315929BC